MRLAGAFAGSARVANYTSIAQHQRILMKVRDSEVIQIARGILELAGPAVDVGSVVSPGHSHDAQITRRISGEQHRLFQRDRFSPRGDPIMLNVIGAVAVLTEDTGCH